MQYKWTPASLEDIAERTEDAYAFNSYKRGSWLACAKMLSRRGFGNMAIEAIMRSKHMRHAHDISGKDYGLTNSADLSRYIKKYPQYFTAKELAELVVGTFT